MKQAAWAAVVLGLMTIAVPVAGAQEPPAEVELKQNRPNPFNPATTIPFTLSAQLFAGEHRPRVWLRIYNVIGQLVAVPILQGGGRPVEGLELECDHSVACEYSAYWDGNVRGTGREAPSGIYLYQLVVDGRRYTRKMMIIK